MIKLANGRYIIGFDNGYQYGKTANVMFENGVLALGKVEPSIKESACLKSVESRNLNLEAER